MSASFYCLDNDIILKLVTCNLFEDTIKTFNIEPTKVKILDSFKYKFGKEIKRKRGNKANIKLPQDNQYNLEKALEVTFNYATLSEEYFHAIEIDIYTKLLNYSAISPDKHNTIDKGEAILISHVSYLNQLGDTTYLLTGDKRCLRALTNSGFSDVIQHLEGKFWCLEQLILKNIDYYGFDLIQDKIYRFLDCDTNLKIIFGYSVKAPEDRVKEDLKKEIIRLKQETGNLLHPYPLLEAVRR